MTVFKALQIRTDGAILTGDEKKNKITAAVSASPVNIATFAVLAVILFFFSLAGTTPALGAFGLNAVEFSTLNQNGTPDFQAGSHPYELTTTFMLNEAEPLANGEFKPSSLKDVTAELPPGVIGNPTATPRCSPEEFAEATSRDVPACPESSVVGYADTFWTFRSGSEGRLRLPNGSGYEEDTVPVYNLQPPPGMPAEFAYKFEDLDPVYLAASVRTGGDYGITINVKDVPTAVAVLGSKVVLWGVPAESSHNPLRGACLEQGQGPPNFEKSRGECPAYVTPQPLLSTPTSCDVAHTATLSVDDWEDPGVFSTLRAPFPEMYGCEKLVFTPSIAVTPETSSSDSPSGLRVDLHIPQDESPGGLNEAELKDATVTLPAGMTVNPSAAAGLAGCSEAQIDLHGPEPAGCPEDSQIGTVELTTPLVSHPLHGAIYLAQQGNAGPAQGSNEFGSLLALYIAVHDPQTGVVVKLAGRVSANPQTGQLTTTFDENPQLPFEDLELDFFGGQQAPLATPATCGSYTATSSLTPWSAIEPANPEEIKHPPAEFKITSGPDGAPCQWVGGPPLPFDPSFTAGTTKNQAGAYSPLTLTLSRQDTEQDFNSLTATLPPGLLAKLAGVPRCGEAEANAGSCPEGSQIGTVTVGAGAGPSPYYVTGKIYLTGPYNGGPFGEVVVVPAIAGPFNLGTVVVRGSIRINPTTAQATVVSDPFPSILQGIPLQIKTVNVALNRSGFMFNPTNCSASSVTGTVASTQGASAAVSSPFEAANCATLPFKPSFTATAAGHASKADGASLIVKVASKGGPGASGEEANIASVKVDLPKQLPSRLTTLQKACSEAQFNANPAGCPKESDVGTATAVTPVLAGGGGGSGGNLTGPAYLVSHGGAAFPDLEIVLQGEGVTLILDGATNIKHGITSSTFRTVPDAPITSFQLTLGTGKFSILGTDLPAKAKYSLCGQTLAMPTAIDGQNGAVIHDTTKITVSGCPKIVKKKKHAKKK